MVRELEQRIEKEVSLKLQNVATRVLFPCLLSLPSCLCIIKLVALGHDGEMAADTRVELDVVLARHGEGRRVKLLFAITLRKGVHQVTVQIVNGRVPEGLQRGNHGGVLSVFCARFDSLLGVHVLVTLNSVRDLLQFLRTLYEWDGTLTRRRDESNSRRDESRLVRKLSWRRHGAKSSAGQCRDTVIGIVCTATLRRVSEASVSAMQLKPSPKPRKDARVVGGVRPPLLFSF